MYRLAYLQTLDGIYAFTLIKRADDALIAELTVSSSWKKKTVSFRCACQITTDVMLVLQKNHSDGPTLRDDSVKWWLLLCKTFIIN